MEEIQHVIEEYQRKYHTWSEIEEKMDTVYFPIVEAFVKELRRLGVAENDADEEQRKAAGTFAKLFFEYMFGTRDFYKFIKDDKAKATTVYPYNMHGSLMISMRLHNADSSIRKTSLKFDVQIKAQPKKVMSAILPWKN